MEDVSNNPAAGLPVCTTEKAMVLPICILFTLVLLIAWLYLICIPDLRRRTKTNRPGEGKDNNVNKPSSKVSVETKRNDTNTPSWRKEAAERRSVEDAARLQANAGNSRRVRDEAQLKNELQKKLDTAIEERDDAQRILAAMSDDLDRAKAIIKKEEERVSGMYQRDRSTGNESGQQTTKTVTINKAANSVAVGNESDLFQSHLNAARLQHERDINGLTTDVEKLKDEIKKLEQSGLDATARFEKCQATLRTREVELARLRGNLDTTKVERNQQKNEVRNASQQTEETGTAPTHEAFEGLQQQYEQLANEGKKRNSEHDALKQQHLQLQESRVKLIKQINQIATENKSLQSSIHLLELETSSTRASHANKLTQAKRNYESQLNQEVNSQQAIIENLVKQQSLLESKHASKIENLKSQHVSEISALKSESRDALIEERRKYETKLEEKLAESKDQDLYSLEAEPIEIERLKNEYAATRELEVEKAREEGRKQALAETIMLNNDRSKANEEELEEAKKAWEADAEKRYEAKMRKMEQNWDEEREKENIEAKLAGRKEAEIEFVTEMEEMQEKLAATREREVEEAKKAGRTEAEKDYELKMNQLQQHFDATLKQEVENAKQAVQAEAETRYTSKMKEVLELTKAEAEAQYNAIIKNELEKAKSSGQMEAEQKFDATMKEEIEKAKEGARTELEAQYRSEMQRALEAEKKAVRAETEAQYNLELKQTLENAKKEGQIETENRYDLEMKEELEKAKKAARAEVEAQYNSQMDGSQHDLDVTRAQDLEEAKQKWQAEVEILYSSKIEKLQQEFNDTHEQELDKAKKRWQADNKAKIDAEIQKLQYQAYVTKEKEIKEAKQSSMAAADRKVDAEKKKLQAEFIATREQELKAARQTERAALASQFYQEKETFRTTLEKQHQKDLEDARISWELEVEMEKELSKEVDLIGEEEMENDLESAKRQWQAEAENVTKQLLEEQEVRLNEQFQAQLRGLHAVQGSPTDESKALTNTDHPRDHPMENEVSHGTLGPLDFSKHALPYAVPVETSLPPSPSDNTPPANAPKGPRNILKPKSRVSASTRSPATPTTSAKPPPRLTVECRTCGCLHVKTPKFFKEHIPACEKWVKERDRGFKKGAPQWPPHADEALFRRAIHSDKRIPKYRVDELEAELKFEYDTQSGSFAHLAKQQATTPMFKSAFALPTAAPVALSPTGNFNFNVPNTPTTPLFTPVQSTEASNTVPGAVFPIAPVSSSSPGSGPNTTVPAEVSSNASGTLSTQPPTLGATHDSSGLRANAAPFVWGAQTQSEQAKSQSEGSNVDELMKKYEGRDEGKDGM